MQPGRAGGRYLPDKAFGVLQRKHGVLEIVGEDAGGAAAAFAETLEGQGEDCGSWQFPAQQEFAQAVGRDMGRSSGVQELERQQAGDRFPEKGPHAPPPENSFLTVKCR
jgi:hypothetical protein